MKTIFTHADIRPCARECAIPGLLELTYTSAVDGRQDWALVRPAERSRLWLVMIHGHGSHGDQLFTRPDVKALLLSPLCQAGFGIVSPNLRDNAWMGPAAAVDLQALLELIRVRFDAQGRFILCGGSMGGTSNLIYAVLHPEDVAGVVAACPATDLAGYYAWGRERNQGVIREIADAIESAYGGPPATRVDIYWRHSAVRNCAHLTMPVRIMHGTADELIPVTQARALAKAMQGRANFYYQELAGGHHDSPLAEMPAALEWVLNKIESVCSKL